MSNIFDVGIIGVGVAGAVACLKIAQDYPDVKTVAFDIGRPPAKRRRQLDGFLGCLPNSDGKLYQRDTDKVAEITGLRKAKSARTWFNNLLKNVNDFEVIKDKKPSIAASKRIAKAGFEIFENDFVQLYPKDIHLLSKQIASEMEASNLTLSFDNEVQKIFKQKGYFLLETESQEYRCKKLIIAVGRAGWRWAKDLYSHFGIIEGNNLAHYGIRLEMSSGHLKEFNKSNCSLIKTGIEVGPFSWFGTVIPEDHDDLAISAFRSNEDRWKTDKVSFTLIGEREFLGKGFEQMDRLSKLIFVLANDRIVKERVALLLSGKSRISIISEYDWLKEAVLNLAEAIPDIVSKAYFHVPTIMPMPPKINIANNLETEIEGMFVVGEAAGVHGILSAASMGVIAADAVCE
jgi:uncharacterized FAD-dependent dehydrogenase